MLQRRRCKCCVWGIFILVISISVFYLTSRANFNGYVDAVHTYPDFRKYAKNVGDTLSGGLGWDDAAQAGRGGEGVPDSLDGVTLRLLMDADSKGYNPVKLDKSNTTKIISSSQENLTLNKVPQISDGQNVKVQEGGVEEGAKVKDQSANGIGYKLSVSYDKQVPSGGGPINTAVENTETKSNDIAINKTTDKLPQDQDSVKPTHILIVTNRRSGSSFLGQIFNQNPDIFFHFEPLKVTEWKKELYPNATELLRNMLKCNFDGTPFLLDMYNKEILHRDSSKALTSPPLCDLTTIESSLIKPVRGCPPLNTKAVTYVCNKHKHITIKMIRMYSLSALEDVIRDPDLNVKVLHLVRDPRGIYTSRVKAEHKPLTLGEALDHDVTYTCRRMKRNLAFLTEMPDWLQGRYLRVRYEDLAQDPKIWSQRLYDFSGLGPVPSAVTQWISANTHGSNSDAYSTQRNSSSTAQAWRKGVPLDIVQRMQDICRPLLGDLGYLEVSTDTELRNISHSLVV